MGCQLKKQVYFGCICKKSVHFEHIWVVCKHLDFYFLSHLILHTCLLDLFLVDHFYSQHETRPEIPCHVDIPKTPFSQFSPDLELGKGQFLALPRGKHGAEVEERLVGILSVRSPDLRIRCKNLLVNSAVLPKFLGKILVLFFLGMSGMSLVRCKHGLVAMSQSLLLHIFNINSSSFFLILPTRFNFLRNGSLITLQSTLRMSLVQSLKTFIGMVILQYIFFV